MPAATATATDDEKHKHDDNDYDDQEDCDDDVGDGRQREREREMAQMRDDENIRSISKFYFGAVGRAPSARRFYTLRSGVNARENVHARVKGESRESPSGRIIPA